MKASRPKGGASPSGSGSGTPLRSSVVFIDTSESFARASTGASSPRESPLASEISSLNLAAVATALARLAGAFGPRAPSPIDDEQLLAFWSLLRTQHRLGYAEIVELLVEMARLCLRFGCQARELPARLGMAPANGGPGPEVSNGTDPLDEVRWVLRMARMTLDKVLANLPLAHAGGVPDSRLRQKQAALEKQAALIAALEM